MSSTATVAPKPAASGTVRAGTSDASVATVAGGWFSLQPLVRLIHPDRGDSLWLADRPVTGKSGATARFLAIELPEHLVLRRTLKLPGSVSPADVRAAVRLDAGTNSPFDGADLVSGFRSGAARDGGGLDVDIALCSRRLIARHTASLGDRLPSAPSPEVWVRSSDGQSWIVIEGFGESRRQQYSARGRGASYALLALAGLFACAIAVTPTIQLKLRAAQASLAYSEAERLAGPVVAQREVLVRAAADIDALRALMNDRVDPMAVTELLTTLVPDDTWLQRLQVQGNKVTMSGQTGNTAALMNILGRHPMVRDVKAPSATTRPSAGAKEHFVVEFVLLPEALRPQAGGASPNPTPTVAAMPSAVAPASAPPTVAAAANPAPTVPAVPPVAVASAAVPVAPVQAVAPSAAAAPAQARTPGPQTTTAAAPAPLPAASPPAGRPGSAVATFGGAAPAPAAPQPKP